MYTYNELKKNRWEAYAVSTGAGGDGMTRRTLLPFANIARAWNAPFLGLRATREEVAVSVFHDCGCVLDWFLYRLVVC